MFLKTVGTIARFSLLALPVVAITTTVNCGDSGNGGTAGTSGTAGATGSAGTTGGGGTSGTGGTGGAALSCTPVAATAADVTMLDWETVAVGATTSSFGNWMPGTYGGGTFQYPGPTAGACDPTMHLCPNFDGKNWHITGTVRDYSGFGIYMNMNVGVWNVSMFTGLQFDISGTFTPTAATDGGAPAATLTFGVTDARHEVDSAHTADARTTCGTCAPSNGNEYDGTCGAPSKVITLTATPTTTVVKWTDLNNGVRPPSFTGESPDPAQITHITWVPPWNGAGSSPYMVDITLDNLKYTTN